MSNSPLAPHLATAAELQARIQAERGGEPFLVVRHPDKGQIILSLAMRTHLTIGRRPENDLAVEWDSRVSRTHAELHLIGADWIVTDNGLSANGTHVNGTFLDQRYRLRDGDLIRIGDTTVAFCRPRDRATQTLAVDAQAQIVASVSPAQRRVLIELCRPYVTTGSLTAPSNAEIAERLFLSVDSIKTHIKALIEAFGRDEAGSRLKRADLVERAVRTGLVSRRDIETER